MANASAEKLKALGLRHGEKVVVGLAVAACIACLALAATQPTIDLTPEQVEQHARSAKSNLEPEAGHRRHPQAARSGQHQEPRLRADGGRQGEERPGRLRLPPAHPYNYPQPGAGLIRDMPELIAPTELVAYPGRGGALVFELDENEPAHRRHREDGGRQRPPPAQPRRSPCLRPRAPPGRSSRRGQEEGGGEEGGRAHGGQGEGPPGRHGDGGPQAGGGRAGRGGRAVQGDHQGPSLGRDHRHPRLQEAPRELPQRAEECRPIPHFKQLDVERQTLQPDGSWSSWEPVDAGPEPRRSSTTSPRRMRNDARRRPVRRAGRPPALPQGGIGSASTSPASSPRRRMRSPEGGGSPAKAPAWGRIPPPPPRCSARPSTEMGSNTRRARG